MVEVWGEREPDFHLLPFINGYHLGCSWEKNLITHSVLLLHRFSSYLKDSRKKDCSEEIVLKLEFKDLKLDQWFGFGGEICDLLSRRSKGEVRWLRAGSCQEAYLG